ncbi:GTP-binding protein [Naegleria gruberi]|uniref:Guanine nucleotide-binding protein-like 1 n=1 Tax=Naegleria gruberi TaxID=5762 RepID=D2VQE5_NAEGR|nr:GTP-binding protein [Naegleria gruberi]EFC40932.1 GTP-binding protein [Naegleria gruberi]|eukprot:XP_002673676.1 GTP-binding protein [Naegleria gruberi strain NEG-M]
MTKKPFSSQQKKQQLQDKRKKKRENAEKKDDMYDWSKWKEVNFEKEDDDVEEVEMNIPKANPLERMGIEDEETEHVVVDEESDNSESSSDDESSSSAAKSIKPREYTSMVTSEFKLKTKFAKDSDEAVQKRRMESLRPLDPYLKGKATFGKFKSLQAEVNEGFEMIPMPIRPPISIGMTKEQVERQEEVYFQKYLKEQILNGKYKEEDLNYFEENVHVWKQLWKTIELSDILFVVADIRHPLFHFPPSLYEYVSNVLKKPFILVLNKCDLISKDKQQRWIRWFNEKYPNVRVCLFTRGTGSGKKTKSKELKLEELKIEKDYAKQIWQVTKQLYDEFKIAKLKRDNEEEQERISKLVGEDFDTLIGECDKIELPTPKPKLKMKKKLRKEKEARRMGNIKEEESESEEEEEEEENQDIDKRCDGCVIGFVGHPNVGKSSIINALTGKKVVSTSYTPGHTKHVQTLYLETKNKMIQFCDCPGLVFPAVGASKALQILSGIYPISQVRDPYSIVRYLAERVDLVKLLKLKQDEYDLENDISWSAWTLSEAYARKRGYMTKKNARPDVYRAANELLRRVLKGDDVALILAFDPPSVKVKPTEDKKESIIPSASSQQSNKDTKKKNKKQPQASDFDYIRELERDTFALHEE